MKRKLVICAVIVFACSLFTNVKAQLLVDSTGKVGICLPFDTIKPLSLLSIGHKGFENSSLSVVSTRSIHGLSSWNNICSKYIVIPEFPRPQWNVAINGETVASTDEDRLVGVRGSATKSSQMTSGRTYGVVGVAGNATSGYNYGTCGFLLYGTPSYGAGIYGDINSFTEVYVPGRYAGYFNGQTRVNGDFYANSVNTTSDARLKTNITEVKQSSLEKIQELRPVQFTWNPIEDFHISDTTSTRKTYLSEDLDYKRLHYGFLAQEVQKLYPELVQEDGDGYLSINYIELIPILVQAVQELSAEVNNLKGTTPNRVMAHMNNEADNVNAILYQNNPNPFTTDTRIGYSLPASTSSASLYIYNMNGAQIADYPITTFGEGSVIIKAGVMDAGMYLYTLIADGQVVDTKRMILTK